LTSYHQTLLKNVDGFWVGHTKTEGGNCILHVEHIPGSIAQNFELAVTVALWKIL